MPANGAPIAAQRRPSVGLWPLVVVAAVCVALLLPGAAALYEDQIGKFDWKLTQIGAVRQAHFHGAAGERIIAVTAHNVLAALHTKTGDIAWRKLLERTDRGAIRFLHVPAIRAAADEAAAPPFDDSDADVDPDVLLTVSGHSPALVRGWNALTGHAEFEWTLTPTANTSDATEHRWLHTAAGHLLHIVPVWGSHLEVTAYQARTGAAVRPTTRRLAAPWALAATGCTLTQTLFVCQSADGGQLSAVDVVGERNEVFVRRVAGERRAPAAGAALRALRGAAVDTVVLAGSGLVVAMRAEPNPAQRVLPAGGAEAAFVSAAGVLVTAQVDETVASRPLLLRSAPLADGAQPATLDASIAHEHHSPAVRIEDVLCKRSSAVATETPVCRVLLTSADGAVKLVQKGVVRWVREEALADIVAVEMIDLQLSDAEGSIETELKSKGDDGSFIAKCDIFGALARRLTGQIAHLRNTLLAVAGLGAPASATQRAGLVRDAFGLHKMLVVLTASGKLFGIDNQSGQQHWQRLLPEFTAFAGASAPPMQIVVQRSAGHFPLGARCTVLARSQRTGRGVLFEFDPITGASSGGGDGSSGIVALPYAVRQAALVAHVRADDFVRALVLLDTDGGVHAWPADAAAQADGLYVWSACTETGVIRGWQVRSRRTGTGEELRALPLWQVDVSGGGGGVGGPHRIVRVAAKNRAERVHSQGRVFNDRSVLYKYVNPNLVAVATIGPDAVHKSILNIHLLDTVSGAIVHSLSHRRVRAPLHIVHSENWLVYAYHNDKLRRTEVTSVELYEGRTQAGNGTVWSSLDAPTQLPLVESQSYVLPAQVVAMRETITERGITNKHVLFALATGSVVEMPWALLDPRRPVLAANQPREEGIIPYIPELPVPSENVINYNQSVASVRGVAVAPSGLESTCLVVAYGLDVFVTRVAPSKTFDLLKEDFDYMLIMLVLLGLSAASVVCKQLSARKTLKQAWR